MRRCVIFDLDGTLTRSEEGIFNCVRYAAAQLGMEEPPVEVFRRFIGPPLKYSFMHELGMDEKTAEEATGLYRQRYQKTGLYENSVYPGIRRLLAGLKRQGDWVAVATGKPQKTSERVLEHFGLSKWLDRVVGPDLSADAGKAELIRRALPEDWKDGEAYMVGDRRFDIEGGKAVGLKTVWAGYGYGSREEYLECGADLYAATVQDLISLLDLSPVTPGWFLSMEGLDGSGKSTQLALLTGALEQYGYEVVHSREPGGCMISEKIREIILDRANQGMTPETEALLYAASRAQHVHDTIRPAVESGRLLLSDRYIDSSVAYQGGGRKLGVDEVMEINRYAVDGLYPDITVFLDLPHDKALARRYQASVPDRMEMEDNAFHSRVEEAYRKMLEMHMERFVTVDASGKPEEIGKEIAQKVLEKLDRMEMNRLTER